MQGKSRWLVVAVVAMLSAMWMNGSARAQTKAPAGKPQDVPLDNRTVHTGPLRVVVAGLVHGHAEGFFSGAVKRKDIEIVGVAEPDRALFDDYAKRYGLDPKLYHEDLEEMLTATKPEAVLAYTNTYDHRRVVEVSAKHHVAVMMEKPLAVSAEDAHAIGKAAAAANIPVLVNYFTTWNPNRRAAYELARGGSIGEVWKMVAHDGHKGPKEIGVGPEFLGWLTDPKLNGGGALYDFGCYGVDFMTWLMGGERPLSVTAVTQQLKPEVYPKVDDDATIVLKYAKAVGISEGSWNWPLGRSDVEIYGKTGEVMTVGGDSMEVRKAEDREAEKVQVKALTPPMDDELRYLTAVVRGELKPEGPGSLEINVVVAEVMDAARESAKTGRAVKLEKK